MRSEQDRLDCTIRAPQAGDFERMAELAGQLGYPCTPQEVAAGLPVYFYLTKSLRMQS